MSDQKASNTNDRARRYTPLLAIAASLLIALFGLPSILNLPQANPNTVVEYAPVPPDSDEAAPPGGNFAGLGLGNGSTVQEETGTPPLGPIAQNGVRSQYRCVIVNGVPRQTEDPLSPPCVSVFSGDNGGSTYQGVTGKDIRVEFYITCGGQNEYAPTSKGQESAPCNTVDDLDKPPSDSDFLYTRVLKRYAVYFNSRYQTYGRHVHFWVYYSDPGPTTVSGPGGCRESCRRADAAKMIDDHHPFSVVGEDAGGFGFMDEFSEAFAQKGILNFGSSAPHTQSFYKKYPGLLWGFAPSIEDQADLYASVVCRQVAHEPVSFSGQANDMGKKRKFGILFSNADGDDYYPPIKKRIVDKIAECGVPKPPEHGYPDGGCALSCDPSMQPTHAAELSDLRRQGVTTILWIGAQTSDYGTEADNINWHPEWLAFGDGTQEDFVTGRYGKADQWQHTWIVSNVTKVGRQDDQLCALAIREVDPNWPSADVSWACDYYDDMRQLFTGIQVAGPKLSPTTIQSGFHSIPAVPSTNPQVPACFYRANDYTCVKDAVTMWWDRNGQIPGWSGQGCFRNVYDGRRFLIDGFPKQNITASKSSKDTCNAYTSNGSLNPYQQTG